MSTTRIPPLWADRTVQLLKDGYLFLPRMRWKHQADIVPLRVLGQPAIAVYGPEGARMLYERPEIKRRHAVPGRVQKTLFGEGGVQSLDDQQHRHRKEMFMRIMEPERLKELGEITSHTLNKHAQRWFGRPSLNLTKASEEVLMEAGAAWAGVPIPDSSIRRRARQMSAMVDSFAAIGPRHWAGRIMRRRAENWMSSIVEQARAGELEPPPGSALSVIASHRDLNGEPLRPVVAGVEVLNIVRTLVAVGRFVAFTGVALHEHGGDPSTDEELKRYVHEVRRFYPFAPFIGGRVDTAFEWEGTRFPKGAMVLLDIYGMNHDSRWWENPQRFDPERFSSRPISPYDYVPQGGGDFHPHHRCAGEDATITVLMEFTRFLSQETTADVPPQDLTIDLGRIPARPASGFVVSNLRPRVGGPG